MSQSKTRVQLFSIIENENKNKDDNSTSCGLGSWRPRVFQIFAHPAVMVAHLCFVSILQSMASSILYGSMNTLEKRFAFNSKVSSVIFIADSITGTLLSPIIGFYALRVNRSRLIGSAQILQALTCFLMASPYFIYGPSKYQQFSSQNPGSTQNPGTCFQEDISTESKCDPETSGSTLWPAVYLLFISSLIRGIGFPVYFAVVMPFIDDNVSKKKSPLYLSALHAISMIGPLGGYYFAAWCLSINEDPWNNSVIDQNDPRFIGAWWLGFLVTGILTLVMSLPLFLYPAEFKTANVKAKEMKEKMKESGGTLKALIIRLIQNPIIMIYFLGNEFRYFALDGFTSFIPKYLQSQYRQTSSNASLLTGTLSIAPISIGLLIGGFYVSWAKPKAKLMLILVFLAEFASFVTVGSGLFLGCEKIKLNGQDRESLSFQSACNQNCHCTTQTFTPICVLDSGTTYFSPCHAGCTDYNHLNSTYSNCSCLTGSPKTGYCPTDLGCRSLSPYVTLLIIGSLISSTAKTGNSLIAFRAVEPMDKGFTNGVIGSLISLFAFIPAAIFYGYIVDSTCLVWETKCGKRGNCWIYDQDQFRNIFIGITAALIALGSLFDFIMIFYADQLKDLYGDKEEEEEEVENY